MSFQYHFEKKFYLDKRTGYYISSSCPKIRAHRWVWENHYGKIPPNYHIHHKDGNKGNNSIENLELIERSCHMSLHMQDEKRKQIAREICDKIRPLTKEWHSSNEGIKWHRKHAINCNFGNWKPIKKKCDECGKIFFSKKRSNKGNNFCHNNCKSKWRRKNGLDNETRKCLNCNRSFEINKYSKVKNCSRECGHEIRRNRSN